MLGAVHMYSDEHHFRKLSFGTVVVSELLLNALAMMRLTFLRLITFHRVQKDCEM